MPLDAIVDDLEGVPEQYRDLYTEQDGTYRLDVQGVEFPDQVQGLKSALQKEREAAKEAHARLKAYGDLDPDAVRKLMAEREKQEDEEAARRGEFEKLLGKKQGEWQKQLEQANGQVESLKGELVGLIRENTARAALEQAGANVKLLLPHVLSRVQVVQEDGRHQAVVLNDEGAPRLNDKGQNMSISELVAEMAESEEFLAAFPAKTQKGGGAANGAGRAGNSASPDASPWAAQEFISKHGLQAFLEQRGISRP